MKYPPPKYDRYNLIPFIWGAQSNPVSRDREQDGIVTGWRKFWCLPGIGFQFCEVQTVLDAEPEGIQHDGTIHPSSGDMVEIPGQGGYEV